MNSEVSNLSYSSIIDNLDGNTLRQAIVHTAENGTELWISSAFFSLDALNLVASNLGSFDKVRLLFGSEADKTNRIKLLEAMRKLSEKDLIAEHESNPILPGLHAAKELIKSGKFEARCYTKCKFHAKAYYTKRSSFPFQNGILGSGNFTRAGLTSNIELNVHLTTEQVSQLQQWYEERWEEAEADQVTEDILREIQRHIELYQPYYLYLKTLLEWGRYHQGGTDPNKLLSLKEKLDPHQWLGYLRAVDIIEREYGVMICDGVGLGKSFIALALMEHYCRQKKNVLLIAPKSIMDASWRGYIDEYLQDFKQPFGSIYEKAMTDLGFDFEAEATTESFAEKLKEFQLLIERVDVVIIDESHNFRAPNTLRYKNLKRLTDAINAESKQRKRVILLTATPVNTHYTDLSTQVGLITQDTGTISGFESTTIARAAKHADKEAKNQRRTQPIMDFQKLEEHREEVLNAVLESIVIQRKRTTCIELSREVGKELSFPIRENPRAIEYHLSEAWSDVVSETHKRFEPVANALSKWQKESGEAGEAGDQQQKTQLQKLKLKEHAIKFAAFLPEQYRTDGSMQANKYRAEMLLTGLVFKNVMKQLESSPAAFQGILQSLGTSLMARLRYMIGEEANEDLASHNEWVQQKINQISSTDQVIDEESDNMADFNGQELDEWLEQAISTKNLDKKLGHFDKRYFDLKKWRKDILKDLDYLKEIHHDTLIAREAQDNKFIAVAAEIQRLLNENKRVVVFTQSQRTSFYLEKAIKDRFPHHKAERIDSSVDQKARAEILHGFCPLYNKLPLDYKERRVDILICTDVLSEGVNMQQAECIINYDIHWNPVRLIQRIGRVDRRLDPIKSPVPHSFSILNCVPPTELDELIKLVSTVENRTMAISRTMGIDQAFFQANDPAGTLREFNTQIDGEPSKFDNAIKNFVALMRNQETDLIQTLDNIPNGAFGVWGNATENAIFVLFEMSTTAEATPYDIERFRGVIGRPVLTMLRSGKTDLYAEGILETLSHTVKGEMSAECPNPQAVSEAIKKCRIAANNSFREANLPASIQPKLICVIQLLKGNN